MRVAKVEGTFKQQRKKSRQTSLSDIHSAQHQYFPSQVLHPTCFWQLGKQYYPSHSGYLLQYQTNSGRPCNTILGIKNQKHPGGLNVCRDGLWYLYRTLEIKMIITLFYLRSNKNCDLKKLLNLAKN